MFIYMSTVHKAQRESKFCSDASIVDLFMHVDIFSSVTGH